MADLGQSRDMYYHYVIDEETKTEGVLKFTQ